ncbi:MAG: hypothetical protein ACI8XZ_003489 [Gammaproteobacteria bacterium]|jgi:hypothetical protein
MEILLPWIISIANRGLISNSHPTGSNLTYTKTHGVKSPAKAVFTTTAILRAA